jgi:putative ABC transport system permease protein
MKSFLADLRFGIRMLRKSPGFAITTIAVLALGIGANAAVFSVVDAVLLRSLPLSDPERVVMLWEKNPALGGSIGERVPSAYTNFLEWTRQATQFEAIAGFEDANFNLTSGPEPERIEGARASANIFTLFGVKPALGTSFDTTATDPDMTHVAVLTDALFRSHFGGQRSALGQTLTLNDVVYTIVGVLPPEFHLPAAREGQDQHSPKLWVPYDASATQNPVEAKRRKMQVYGRLRDGVSLAQARAEMDGIAKRLAEEDPTQNAGFGVSVFPVSVENLGQDLRRNLLVMLGAVGFVLLIACANIANLMLTRAAARQKEMAIRKALGAGSGRLVSQLLAESLLLSGAGAALGLGLAHFGIKALVALRPAGITRPEDIQLNLTVLIFTIALSIAAGVFFGIVPALQAARTDVNAFLNQTRGAQSGSSSRMRRALVVAEVALACVLLVGAGFMMKSMLAVLNVDPGFRADHLLTMKFSMPASRYASDVQIAAFCRQVEEKIAVMGGVKSVSFSDGLPLTRIRLTRFLLEGQPAPARGSEPTADMRGIFSPGYFDTVGIRLVAGRNFTAEELQTKAPVLVMNQTLAKRLWPNEDAVGQHLRSVPSRPDTPPVVSTVIGVVADTHQEGLESRTRPEITKPMVDFTQLTLAVRAMGDPEALITSVKSQVWWVDKNLPVFEVRTMEQILDEDTSQRRFQSFVMSVFAGLALVLAAIGLFGVLASLVGQRTQEIGIRMALGAQSKDVLRMVLGEGMRMVLLGVVIGVGAGVGLSRYLESLFFGVSSANAATYLEVALMMISIALVACLVPAWRAIRVNPMVALRYE